MANLLELKRMEVKYRTSAGTLTAVRDINFSISPGEIVGIVGESGCGKSTVAAATMRLLPPNGFINDGQVLFNNQDLCKMSEDELRTLRGSQIAMIFQDPMTSLNPVFNIQTQMVDILRAHNGAHEREALKQKAFTMLERVGIPDVPDRIKNFPHQFSGGMRQRILIAMALMSNPALLIADEPTSALDVTLEAQILELIRGLRDEFGTAILYISHDLGVIAQLSDQVIVMYAGNIVEKGDCYSIFESPQHPYTRALLAAYPSHRQRRQRLAAIPGRVPSLKDLPLGCKFSDRCAFATPVCFTTEPSSYTIDEGHMVLCHLFEGGGTITEDQTLETASIATSENIGVQSGIIHHPTENILVSTQDLHTHFADRAGMFGQLFGKQVGYVRAVDGLDINIKRGETIGLVGESGSGKTTLGKTILRLVESTKGIINFDGQDITHLSEARVRPLRPRMQMIYQDPYSSLSPRMKVSSLLIEPFRIQGVPVDPKTKVPELLEMVGLSAEQADKYPHELSGGQARRVGFARALALNPDFLVADEPTSGLDVSVAASVLNLLKDLRDELDLTYLIITHNLNVINFISDTVGVMYLGRLVELGPTDALYHRPAHPYTEALMAAISEPNPWQREFRKDRVLIRGEIPSPKNPPTGCTFHPRCVYADERCAHEEPELVRYEKDHLTACFYPYRIGTYLKPSKY
jgi:peptide/nickel transport system ATP-binding protein